MLALLLALIPQELAPCARGHFGIVYDSKSARTILCGGAAIRDGNLAQCEDTWSWDGEHWEQLARSGPAIMGHRLAYDSKRDRVLLLGGSAGELREWSAKGWSPLAWTDVPKADDPGFCYDTAHDQLVAVVADPAQKELATWIATGSKWSRVAGAGPEGRSFYSCACDAKRSRVVLFGGRIADQLAPADVWLFDGTKWEKKSPAAGPPPRAAAGMVYDDKLGAVVLHGGMDAQFHWLPDTWTWNGTAWAKLAGDGPALEHALAYDRRRDRVVLVGAPTHEDPAAALETWEWDGKAWARRPGQSAPKPGK